MDKPGLLIGLCLGPSRMKLLREIKRAGNEMLQTTKKIVKLESNEEVEVIPSTTEELIKQRTSIDPEQFQWLACPKALNGKQEAWLR